MLGGRALPALAACTRRGRRQITPCTDHTNLLSRACSSEKRAELVRQLTMSRKFTVGELLREQHIFPSDTSMFAIVQNAPLSEAVQQMVHVDVGSLVVKCPEGKLSGILTERDYLRATGAADAKVSNTANLLVSDIMTPRHKLVTVTSGATVSQCVSLMSSNQFRHLPVVEQLSDGDDRFVGMVSAKMLLGKLLEYHELQVEHMQGFLPFPVW